MPTSDEDDARHAKDDSAQVAFPWTGGAPHSREPHVAAPPALLFLEQPVCLACRSPRLAHAVVLLRTREPHDHELHESVYAHRVLAICGACRGGQIESFLHACRDLRRRHSPFREVPDWDQYDDGPHESRQWLLLTDTDAAYVLQAFSGCPATHSGSCRCETHIEIQERLDQITCVRCRVRTPTPHVHRVDVTVGPDGTLEFYETGGVSVPFDSRSGTSMADGFGSTAGPA